MTCEGRNREVRSSEETRAGRTVGWRVTGRQEKAEGAFEPNVPNATVPHWEGRSSIIFRGQNRTEREHSDAESWALRHLHPSSQEHGPSSLRPLPQNPAPGGFLFPQKV